jgi:PIN domain nuclease of toxin-antitoxin system
MKLLLDSHVLVWWLQDPLQLSEPSRKAISNPANEVYMSAANIWELELKMARGKLTMPKGYVDILRQDGIAELSATIQHAEASAGITPHHADPFDRLLISQAMLENMVLVSRDSWFPAYEVPLLRA